MWINMIIWLILNHQKEKEICKIRHWNYKDILKQACGVSENQPFYLLQKG